MPCGWFAGRGPWLRWRGITVSTALFCCHGAPRLRGFARLQVLVAKGQLQKMSRKGPAQRDLFLVSLPHAARRASRCSRKGCRLCSQTGCLSCRRKDGLPFYCQVGISPDVRKTPRLEDAAVGITPLAHPPCSPLFQFSDMLIYATRSPIGLGGKYSSPRVFPLDQVCAEVLAKPIVGMSFPVLVSAESKSFYLSGVTEEESSAWVEVRCRLIPLAQSCDGLHKLLSLGGTSWPPGRLRPRSQVITATARALRRRHTHCLMSVSEGEPVALGLKAPVWVPDKAVSMCQVCGVNL